MTKTNHKSKLHGEGHFTQASIGLASLDTELRFLHVNEQFAALFENKVEDFLGFTLRQVLPDQAETHESMLKRMLENGLPRVDQPFPVCPDDSINKVPAWRATFSPIHSKKGDIQGIHILVRDATTEQRIKALLAGRTRILRKLARGAQLEKVLSTLITVFEEQEPGMMGSILLLEGNGKRLRHGSAPSLPEAYVQAIDGMAVGPNSGSCGTAVFRRQQVIVGEIHQDPLWENFRQLATKHGLRSCWSQPIFSSTDQILGTFAIYFREPRIPDLASLELFDAAADLAGVALETRQAQESLENSEARTRHSQKLESLGVLAGGIAHDFNNILTGILGNAGLAQSRLPEGSPSRRPLVEIEMAAQHAAELANQMLAYSGKGQFVIEPLDLDQLVDEIVHLLRLSISKKAKLEFRLARNLPQVKGDISQIRQVVMNLITNASDALGDQGGQIVVSTELVEADHSLLDEMYLKENLSPGTYVCLKVSDTGCGMDKETQDRLFDPFFTTKATGRGLGMAAVLGILRGHQGSVRVTSYPQEGTTFTILLPASAEKKLETDFPETTTPELSKKGIVLVVDDEEMIRTVARNILEDFGHEVLEACDGQEAVDLFNQSASGIDAVLLDMTMPNIDGPETLRRLRHVRPEVRILLSSGYSEQEALRLMADYDGVGFLKKPYLPGELIGKLQEFLEG